MSNKLTEQTTSTTQPTDFIVNLAGVIKRLTWSGFTALLDARYAAIGHDHDADYVANLYTITGLTGGGSTNLDGKVTTDVTVGFCAFLPALLISSVVVPKMMQLVAGTDAENADPAAGLIIVRPDDFNASTNAKVWKEKL